MILPLLEKMRGKFARFAFQSEPQAWQKLARKVEQCLDQPAKDDGTNLVAFSVLMPRGDPIKLFRFLCHFRRTSLRNLAEIKNVDERKKANIAAAVYLAFNELHETRSKSLECVAAKLRIISMLAEMGAAVELSQAEERAALVAVKGELDTFIHNRAGSIVSARVTVNA